jgi:hypothetical protein
MIDTTIKILFKPYSDVLLSADGGLQKLESNKI